MNIQEWRQFFYATPGGLTEEQCAQAMVDAQSADWDSCPVAALAPEVCARYRAHSAELAVLIRENVYARDERLARLPLLFRMGCDWGDLVEELYEARYAEDWPLFRELHAKARDGFEALLKELARR